MRVNLRTQVPLSRRDQMKVARHGMPGMCHPEARPVGYGMIGWREGAIVSGGGQTWRHRSNRSLRDGSCLLFTRRFMRGYPRFVPPGQRLAPLGRRLRGAGGRKPRYLWDRTLDLHWAYAQQNLLAPVPGYLSS